MDHIGPDKIERERETLIADIHEALKGVTRERGVSWSETLVIDNYGSDEERAAARAGDTETSWTELVDDPAWVKNEALGELSFLDSIGFRYYLPAEMVLALRVWDFSRSMSLLYHLVLPGVGDDLREWRLEKRLLLDQEQRRVVGRFIRFMEINGIEWWPAEHRNSYEKDWATPWREAYESYWANV